MFELFISLFGGAYYASKLVGEKAKSRTIDRETRQWIDGMQSDMEHWLESVVDKEYEWKVDTYLSNPSNIKQLYESTRFIFSDIEGFSFVADFDAFATNYRYMTPYVKRILMADKGKIPYRDAKSGMRSPGIYDIPELNRWKRNHEFMKWYSKELEKHDIEPLLFANGVDLSLIKQHPENAKSTDAVTQPVGGRYFWWSGRQYLGIY